MLIIPCNIDLPSKIHVDYTVGVPKCIRGWSHDSCTILSIVIALTKMVALDTDLFKQLCTKSFLLLGIFFDRLGTCFQQKLRC
jgi:hypothetical protein